jgi:bla regulator protein BlaR1
MNRTILRLTAASSATSLLLVDSAVKGAALLVLAAVAALILRRDSAATRHFVWMLAIVALLVVPVLSALLPHWRVLPAWTGIAPARVVVETASSPIPMPAVSAAQWPWSEALNGVERPSATAHRPASDPPDSQPAPVAPENVPGSAVWSRNWIKALPLVWVIGFSALILRLLAARWLLWNSGRQGTVLGSSRQPAIAARDPIVTVLEGVRSQLGIHGPVSVSLHPDKTIPLVWGIVRPRLLLPAAARDWSGEQLRSVLLHELAHVKRRDTLAQLLVQVACAVHWFNPLVWFAAWRLGVERERASDDLVLASGVRPSAYAGHLLEVVTGLSPARWARSGGLTMARKSSLEGRLVAVLSENLNRRGVSVALAAIALAMALGIAVPVAMLRAADEKPGAPVRRCGSRKRRSRTLPRSSRRARRRSSSGANR